MVEKTSGDVVVVCDGCGDAIEESGTMCTEHEGSDKMLHFCDMCSTSANQEFRICMQCGEPMTDGMTNLEDVYVHEKCFEPWMDENCPGGWRETEDDGLDGYYEELVDGKWRGTGIFYTTWY